MLYSLLPVTCGVNSEASCNSMRWGRTQLRLAISWKKYSYDLVTTWPSLDSNWPKSRKLYGI